MNKPKKIEPIVNLISATPDAVKILAYTRESRLGGEKDFEKFLLNPKYTASEILKKIFTTVLTSLEFIQYIFELKNVTRNFTHQLVRTRTNSYQQESLRAVDVGDANFDIEDDPIFINALNNIKKAYNSMVDKGMSLQKARKILPQSIHTKILFSANLRSLSNMAELRLCKRTEGEYQKVFKLIIKKILEIHPWAKSLLQPYCVKTGICYFPRYYDCPVKKNTIVIPDAVKRSIKETFDCTNYEGDPSYQIKKEGKI